MDLDHWREAYKPPPRITYSQLVNSRVKPAVKKKDHGVTVKRIYRR